MVLFLLKTVQLKSGKLFLDFKPPTETFERAGRIESLTQKMIEAGGAPISD